MELSMHVKHSIIDRTWQRYQHASKHQKRQILAEFCTTTGYARHYAAWVLAHWGRTVSTTIAGREVSYKVGTRVALPRSGRPRHYDDDFLLTLRELWALFDYLCGKRLVPLLRDLVDLLYASGSFECSQEIRSLLTTVSPATVDRLLADERKKFHIRGSSITRPGRLLKQQIPLRTFSDWGDVVPGFVEADLVAHDGGSAFGDFLCTLTLTDVATGWTESIAVLNKAQKHVFPGLKALRAALPFPLLGLNTDNGSEFINDHLARYCAQEHIHFTRSRPYKKNDNCFVEQKNYSVVRRPVGYARFDSPEALAALNSLYARLRLLTNFVYPSMKLIAKTRVGAKVSKTYDTPRTPFRRVLDAPSIPDTVKQSLRDQYASFNPLTLAREFKVLQDALLPLAVPLTNPRKPYKVFHARPIPSPALRMIYL